MIRRDVEAKLRREVRGELRSDLRTVRSRDDPRGVNRLDAGENARDVRRRQRTTERSVDFALVLDVDEHVVVRAERRGRREDAVPEMARVQSGNVFTGERHVDDETLVASTIENEQ